MYYDKPTLVTFEEWWAYEGKRRRERPYSPETSISWKLVGWGTLEVYEKATLHRARYSKGDDDELGQPKH
mgnify:CR=1 FL=1